MPADRIRNELPIEGGDIRGFAFGLFYYVVNVGALLAGPLVDALTVYYNDKESAGGTDNEAADAVASSSPRPSTHAYFS